MTPLCAAIASSRSSKNSKRPSSLNPSPTPVKSHPKIIDRILDAVRISRTLCVVGHIRPDGDCVGSQLGLALALRAEGKKVLCWNQDPMPQKYRFLDREGLFQIPKRGL